MFNKEILKNDENLMMVLRSAQFATEKHQHQRRDGGKDIPYINHPIQVARLVADAKGNVESICAALLHDTIEDCGVKDKEIIDIFDNVIFGEKVLSIVKEVSDPPELTSRAEQKKIQTEKMKKGYTPEAKLIKIADQTCNMQDMSNNPPKWGGDEEEENIILMKILVDAGVGTNSIIESMFDSAYKKAKTFYKMQ